ncbi:MAG: hypothetical protein ACRDUW_05035 [Pseudonocardiaceae bacterium]
MTRPSKNPLGMAIQDIVAGAVHQVLLGILPHHHKVRIEETGRAVSDATGKSLRSPRAIAEYCLDNDLVHDMLKSLFEHLAGR